MLLILEMQFCYTVQVSSNHLQLIGMRIKLFSHIPNISILILILSHKLVLRDFCAEKEVGSKFKKPRYYEHIWFSTF